MALWIKICANTSLADALMATEAGADAVGFVFAPSRRQVTPKQAGQIAAQLPAGVERVGVFAGPASSSENEADSIARAASTAALTAVQLHGGLDLRFAALLRGKLTPGIALIHTLHWDVEHNHAAAAQVSEHLCEARALSPQDRLLVDAKVGKSSGGLGVAFSWTEAAAVLRAPGHRLILAGGLRPETVAEAIQLLQPYGVDVASGVERTLGVKDRAKVEAFVKNARNAERAIRA